MESNLKLTPELINRLQKSLLDLFNDDISKLTLHMTIKSIKYKYNAEFKVVNDDYIILRLKDNTEKLITRDDLKAHFNELIGFDYL